MRRCEGPTYGDIISLAMNTGICHRLGRRHWRRQFGQLFWRRPWADAYPDCFIKNL